MLLYYREGDYSPRVVLLIVDPRVRRVGEGLPIVRRVGEVPAVLG